MIAMSVGAALMFVVGYTLCIMAVWKLAKLIYKRSR